MFSLQLVLFPNYWNKKFVKYLKYLVFYFVVVCSFIKTAVYSLHSDEGRIFLEMFLEIRKINYSVFST